MSYVYAYVCLFFWGEGGGGVRGRGAANGDAFSELYHHIAVAEWRCSGES